MDVNDSLKADGHVYDQDRLRSVHNHEPMQDPCFPRAFERGARAAGRDDAREHCVARNRSLRLAASVGRHLQTLVSVKWGI